MKQIVPDVYVIEGLRIAHVYLLVSESGLTLVDTGAPGEVNKIVTEIKEGGFSLFDLRAIVLTHAHSDHTGGGAELARRSGAQVMVHQNEVPYVEQTARLPYKSPLSRLLFKLVGLLMGADSCQVGRSLQDGDVVEALGGLQVIHVPGHTPGSIALYQPERQVLFCGDVFFNDNPKKGMQVASWIVSVDVAQTLESARKLAALPVEVLCVSHGELVVEQAGTKMQEAVK